MRPQTVEKIIFLKLFLACWCPLGALFAILGPLLGTLKTLRNLFAGLGALLGCPWGGLGRSWGGLGGSWGALGGVLGGSWAVLGCSWGVSGRPWGGLGRSWGDMKSSLISRSMLISRQDGLRGALEAPKSRNTHFQMVFQWFLRPSWGDLGPILGPGAHFL